MNKKDEAVKRQRKKKYGDATFNHASLGRMWGSILQQHWKKPVPDIPADIVGLMFACSKLGRAALNPGDPDHYLDARVYVALAEEADAERSKTSEKHAKGQPSR